MDTYWRYCSESAFRVTHRFLTGAELSGAQLAQVFDGRGGDPAKFGRQLDRSGIDFAILRSETHHESSQHHTHFDASVAGALLAQHTASVGLVIAAAPLRDHPYNLARRISSLDHISRGRAGWLITSADPAATRGSVWTGDGADTTAVLADAVTVARKLWESWPDDSIIGDVDNAVYADSERIVHVDHVGVHEVAGPLNVLEPPQSQVPVFWQSSGGSGADVVAELADVVLSPDGDAAGRLVLDIRRLESGTPEHRDTAAGTVVWGGGTAAEVVAAAAEYVDAAAPVPTGASLRDRLGLPAPRPTLVGSLRSAFPPP